MNKTIIAVIIAIILSAAAFWAIDIGMGTKEVEIEVPTGDIETETIEVEVPTGNVEM